MDFFIAGYCRILQDNFLMEDLLQLIKNHESKILEFKRDLSSILPILKTIVAFANTAGGTLIIGISSEHKVIGVKNVSLAEEMLANVIADSIFPSILPEIEIATVQKKTIIVIKVPHWRGPFYLKKEGTPNGVYIRLGSTSRPAGPEMIEELKRSVTNLSYDQQGIPELTLKALNFDQIREVFNAAKREIDEKKCHSLGIVTCVSDKVVPSIGGLILFGTEEFRNKYVPDARVRCARFRGVDKAHIIDQFEVEGTILDAILEVPKFIARNTRLGADFQHFRRKDIPEYPELAIREVLINALVHADYAIGGSTIQVAVFDNRLEIQNPGMLPFGFTLDDLKAGVSRIRNRVIARIFHELKLMEEWGSGYKRVIDTCRENHYPEPEWEEFGTSVRVTFFSFGKNRSLPSVKGQLSARQQEILSLLRGTKNMSFKAIVEKLSEPVSDRMLRYDLAELKKRGLLTSLGKGRSTVWQSHT